MKNQYYYALAVSILAMSAASVSFAEESNGQASVAAPVGLEGGATAHFSPTGQSSDTAAKTEKASAKERVVCQVYTPTGSRLGQKKICHTVGEWEQTRRASQQSVERIQQNSTLPTPGN